MKSKLRRYSRLFAPRHVGEPAHMQLVGDSHGLGGSVAVFGDDQVSLTAAWIVALVGIGAMNEDHQVAILLDGSRLTKVGQLGALVVALFGFAVELAERDYRNLEFFGEQLQASGVFGDLLLASAALDRLLHHAHVIEMDGDTFRNPPASKRTRPNGVGRAA